MQRRNLVGPPDLGQVRGRPRGTMVKLILKHQQELAKHREKRAGEAARPRAVWAEARSIRHKSQACLERASMQPGGRGEWTGPGPTTQGLTC